MNAQEKYFNLTGSFVARLVETRNKFDSTFNDRDQIFGNSVLGPKLKLMKSFLDIFCVLLLII